MESIAQVRRIIVQILLKFFLILCWWSNSRWIWPVWNWFWSAWWQRRMIWLVPACKFHFLQIAIKGNFSFLKYIYLRFISIVRKFENLSTVFLLAYSSRHSIWVPWIKKCLRQVEQGFSQFLQKKYVNIGRFFNVSQPIWPISLNIYYGFWYPIHHYTRVRMRRGKGKKERKINGISCQPSLDFSLWV